MAVVSLLAPPLAAFPEFPSVGESVLFQLNGLVVVFLALGSIWAMLEVLGLFFRRAPAPAPAAAESTLSPELVAVISAAVHLTVSGRPHRIAAIVPAPLLESELDWAREGRRTIFASHQPR